MRKVEFLGKMPDPFLKEDGSRMTKEEWYQNRDEIRKKIVDIEYGGMPPRPEYLDIHRLNVGTASHVSTWYKIKAGKNNHQKENQYHWRGYATK